MRNTLKQAIVLWGMVLLLVLWSVFISPSGVLRWAGAAAIVLAVAALLIYRRRQAWTEMTGDAGLSSLPPETYRQPVVLVCGGLSAHLFTDSPVRQVSEGLYLHVPDEEQLVAQVERLLTLRPAWASQLAVAYTVMPGIHRDVAVLAGRLRRFAHSMATVRRRAGVNVPWLLWSGLSGSPLPERASSPWFICTGGEVQVATSTETTMPAQWIAQSGVQERSQRLCYLLKAESLMQWLDLNVLAELNGPEAKCPPLAMAVGLVPSLPAVDMLLLTTCLGFFALSAVVKKAVVVILVAVTAAVMAYWPRKKGQVVAADVWPSSLPPEPYRQPGVRVCGDMSAHLFTDSPVRQVSEGLYLPVSDEEQLVAQVERLLTLRPAWASQFAVAYTVMPVMYRDAAVLTGQLRRFAHSMATVRRRAGVNVPWLLWSGLSGSPLPERANSPWFICTGGEVQVATSAETTMPAQWIAQSGAQERSQRLCYLLKAESLMQWLDLNVLAELNGPEAKCPPLAMTVGLVPSLPAVDNNLWQLWITARTGLTPDIADTGTDDALPFPDALLRRLPRQSGFTPLRRACVTMLGVTTVAGIAALCLSATANRQLLRQVGDDLHRFYAVPAEEFITKARHLSVLKDDAVMLDGYYREGEPLRLGLGLYPGERIRQPVLRAIRDWRPPEQKMDVTASLPVQTVRLDSMSLFDVGQARLKDGSTKVLVDALVNIRAKPGWLILVAG